MSDLHIVAALATDGDLQRGAGFPVYISSDVALSYLRALCLDGPAGESS
jgi:hypothetical protein